ncbi:MAG: ankyrin repeat domain-containing protein [Pseudomonadota bacterium]
MRSRYNLNPRSCSSQDLNQYLIAAVKENDVERAKKLLEAGADVNAVDKEGDTALNWAAYKGNDDLVQILIDASADLNLPGYQNKTPLINAASKGYTQNAQILIAADADVNAVDKEGDTALNLAADKGNDDLVQILIDAGADVNSPGFQNRTPLMDTAIKGHAQNARILIAADADVNAVGEEGYTALLLAAYEGNYDLVRILIDAGADVNAVDKEGNMALEIAIKMGRSQSVIKILKQIAAIDNWFYLGVSLSCDTDDLPIIRVFHHLKKSIYLHVACQLDNFHQYHSSIEYLEHMQLTDLSISYRAKYENDGIIDIQSMFKQTKQHLQINEIETLNNYFIFITKLHAQCYYNDITGIQCLAKGHLQSISDVWTETRQIDDNNQPYINLIGMFLFGNDNKLAEIAIILAARGLIILDHILEHKANAIPTFLTSKYNKLMASLESKKQDIIAA